jgi:hypothetical protein
MTRPSMPLDLGGKTSTYAGHTPRFANEGREGGSFASTGETPIVPAYPRLPPASPWAGDLVPPEEPLGCRVDDLPDMTLVRSSLRLYGQTITAPPEYMMMTIGWQKLGAGSATCSVERQPSTERWLCQRQCRPKKSKN